MESKTIIQNISAALGIDQLNDMQLRMLNSTAPTILLTAPTGTGKTLAFAVRLLKNLTPPDGTVQAVIIAPSRELALQIFNVVRPISTGYKTVALYGGHSMTDERNSLSPTPDIIIATPGRLLDHLQRRQLNIDPLNTLVLDEYDKTLQLGFEGEMKRIVARIGKVKNLILTSATSLNPLPDYLPLRNPQIIEWSAGNSPRNRMQIVDVTSFARDKLDTLVNLLKSFRPSDRSIIFVNHRESAERVYNRLHDEHLPAALYHGGLDQHQRQLALDLFTNGTTPILVATDLAARGLDIADVKNIIHYHIPVDEQAWTHRNGRTARMDASGTIWVITSEADNRPQFINADRNFIPPANDSMPQPPATASLYINAGKKEKISRGDIAGFISASGITTANEIGKITVHDHHAIAAIPAQKAKSTLKLLNNLKLKGKKTRVTIINP